MKFVAFECSPRGFTLMELLVALAVFAVTVALVADLFMAASRRQARIVAATRVQGDARRVLDTISRELRDGVLAYDARAPDAVALRDADGDAVRIERSSDGCPSDGVPCIRIGRARGAEPIAYASLTSANVVVESFDVRIAPDADPFVWDAGSGAYGADVQPHATVYLRLSTATGKSGDRATIEAQTTTASRAYRR